MNDVLVYVLIEDGDYDCGDDVKSVHVTLEGAQATNPGEWEHIQVEHVDYWRLRGHGLRIEAHEVKEP